MAYSWISASVLGFDLCRWPGGGAAAGVLADGLSADASYVESLAAAPAAPAQTREQALVMLRDARATEILAVVDLSEELTDELAGTSSRSPGDGPPGSVPGDGTVDLRDGSLDRRLDSLRGRALVQRFGGPEDLVQLADTATLPLAAPDVPAGRLLDAGRRLGDAVLGHLLAASTGRGEEPDAGDATDAPGTDALVEALVAGHGGVDPPPPPDLGPASDAVHQLLAQIRTGGTADPLGLLAAPCLPGHSGQTWAGAMHAVSWAAELSGRTGVAGIAQMRCVSAVLDAGLGPRQCAAGAWNAASGMVAALVVGDLLADADLTELSRSSV